MKTRAQLEAEAAAKYRKMAKKWGITADDAEKKARALFSNNSDQNLRDFLKKPMKGLSINALDPAHAKADAELQKMAREINRVYMQAADEMQAKLDAYLKKFEGSDKRMQKNLADGKITESYYKQWRQDQLLQTKQWERLRNTLAVDASNANDLARSMIRGHIPEVYAENYNYGVYEVENGLKIDTSFALYDHQTVERLMRENPKLLPDPRAGSKIAIAIAKNRDLKWNRSQIQGELLQGILQGESNQTIAKRMKSVTGKNFGANMRYARTMTTAAENAGRIDSYGRAQDMGIDIRPTWMATLDGRTRDSHRAIDGEKRDPKTGMFSNRCRFPGDPEGPGAEVWNCRCTLVASVKGFEKDFSDLPWRKNDKLNEMSYEEWKAGKKKAERKDTAIQTSVVQGKDISGTWQRRPDKFDFEIEDVMDAQGFDGKPRVVSQAEFDEAVKAANGGKGFIAQRTYSAPNEEVLKAYQDQLYNGKWYVDCSTGGAQYGQGMYCAADYTGKLSSGIKTEMQHYRDLGSTRRTLLIDNRQISKAADVQWGRIKNKISFPYDTGKGEILHNEQDVKKYLSGVIGKLDYKKIEKLYGVSGRNRMAVQNSVSKIETLTLDPTAKIITHRDAINMYNGVVSNEKLREINKNVIEKSINKKFSGLNKIEMQFLRNNAGIDQMGWKEAHEIEKQIKPERQQEIMSKYMDMESDISARSKAEQQKAIDDYEKNKGKGKYDDLGSYIAARGYDAINAEGHGESGSYTVILNRTKLIIRGDK